MIFVQYDRTITCFDDKYRQYE